MNRTRLLLLLIPLLAQSVHAADDDATTPLPDERYAAMAKKSPFALATAVAAPAAPAASFAANWYVHGIARLGTQDCVTIKSRDTATLFSVYSGETTNGVSLASVEWSDTLGKSKVVLRKGTEMATLEFNQMEIQGPPPASAPGAAPGAATAAAAQRGGVVPVNPATATKGPMPFPNASKPGSMPPNPSRPVVVTPLQQSRPVTPGTGEMGGPRRRVMPIPAPTVLPDKP